MEVSKSVVLDVLSVCMIRHEIDTRCKDCEYYGDKCREAHYYAYRAVDVLKQKEVENGVIKNSNAGTRLSYEGKRSFRSLFENDEP